MNIRLKEFQVEVLNEDMEATSLLKVVEIAATAESSDAGASDSTHDQASR